ncbi:hypothetical protein G6L74_09125 [Agrobacterium tumefaciens]|uniref:hypothetical protein n=1 Tax=Agrobacterium tumefaciens TaxID=358 RepID=UPI001572EAF2|nr:hypothetical protein [Agrobacterium tumefaciens]
MSKPAIYDQFDKAFNRVSAYVVLDKSGECVAKIAFKFPTDGAGRLYAYVHWLGVPMVRGYAGGYGYDKRSAAVANAVNKMIVPVEMEPLIAAAMHIFLGATESDSGEYWDTRLRNAGFTVIQAV